MAETGWVRWIHSKLPWAAIGTSVGLLIGILGLYSAFHEKKAEVSYDVISEANVLDVRQPLTDLAVQFQGEDIQKRNLNLRIITVRVRNSGEADILQGHYDTDTPWGLELAPGRIVEVRLTESNSDYLRENLKPQLLSDNFISLRKVIFERGSFFSLEMLILHSKQDSPVLIPRGKIAGIDKPIIVQSWQASGQGSSWRTVLSGNLWVQATRLSVYCTIGILIFMGIAGIWAAKERRRVTRARAERRMKMAEAVASEFPRDSEVQRVLTDLLGDADWKPQWVYDLTRAPNFFLPEDVASVLTRLNLVSRDTALLWHAHPKLVKALRAALSPNASPEPRSTIMGSEATHALQDHGRALPEVNPDK